MIDYQDELEKRGLDTHQTGDDYMMMLCPFHDEMNPSFSVSTKDGTFRCFGCEERGTFADLIAELEDVSISEAIRQIKSDTKISDLLSVIEKGLEPKDEVLSYFNERSFHSVFPPVWGTLGENYLLTPQDTPVDMTLAKPRGLTREIVERFDVRWGERGKYAGRVIFPIRMPSGKILSYVGRTIYKKVHPKTRKPRSPARTLFGIYELLRHFGKTKYIVLVEGEIDAIYLQQHGVPAISNMGTSMITKYQLSILRKLKSAVVLSYDADAAGVKAMFGDGKRRIGEMKILSHHLPTIAVMLPDDRDPNDLTPKEIRGFFGRFSVNK